TIGHHHTRIQSEATSEFQASQPARIRQEAPAAMNALGKPRHPLVDTALGLARTWCAGHVIDEAPAFAHAVRVAVTLDRHLPAAPPGLLAAALLHDAPDYAPADIDLDALLTVRFGPDVVRVVRALEREHRGLDSGPGGPPIP